MLPAALPRACRGEAEGHSLEEAALFRPLIGSFPARSCRPSPPPERACRGQRPSAEGADCWGDGGCGPLTGRPPLPGWAPWVGLWASLCLYLWYKEEACVMGGRVAPRLCRVSRLMRSGHNYSPDKRQRGPWSSVERRRPVNPGRPRVTHILLASGWGGC